MSPVTSVARRRNIAVIAFEGITPFHLSVPCLVFGSHVAGVDTMAFDITVCAPRAGPLATSAGFSISTTADLTAVDEADIIVMPSWHADGRSAPDNLLDSLRRGHARGAIIVGLCLGAFPLAQAGLLDGRTVATHWASAELLAKRYPRVNVDQHVLYVDDGDILSSAGVAAGLDCCLHLLRRLCGAEVANRVAKHILVAPRRTATAGRHSSSSGRCPTTQRPLASPSCSTG